MLALDITAETIEMQLVLHEYRMERRETEQGAEHEDECEHADESDRHARWCLVATRRFCATVLGCLIVVELEVGLGFGDICGQAVAQPRLDEAGELRIDLARLGAR